MKETKTRTVEGHREVPADAAVLHPVCNDRTDGVKHLLRAESRVVILPL